MNPDLKKILDDTDNVVFFGGAGVSTESGIPDFRSVDGLYSQKYKYPPETMLSASFFHGKTEEFYDFYREKMLALWAEPNDAHRALADMEKSGKVRAVITQNIDGLHQKAGSVNVFELHGTVHKNYCLKCRKFYDISVIVESKGIPRCECGGIIKPDVVLYEEGLDNEVISAAVKHIKESDVLIIGGTSLAVYPAASLINYFAGRKLVLINKSRTPRDDEASLVIRDSIGQALKED